MAGSAVALATAVAPSAPLQAGENAPQSRDLERYRQRLHQLFERLDDNRNQRLEKGEVRGHPYLEKHFDRLDRSGRGSLDPSDLVPQRADLLGERLRERFQQADRNRNGRIERPETGDFLWLRENFSRADRNGDGAVSLPELTEFRRRQAPAGGG
ncbi:MAG: EF-hand domain-containing protein [Prochlorococcaceae cyanobacterium]